MLNIEKYLCLEIGACSLLVGCNLTAAHLLFDFAFRKDNDLCLAIHVFEAPDTVLLVFAVVSDVASAVRPLDEGRSLQLAINRCELSDVTVLKRVGLDDTLLTTLFALLESADLHHFVVLVDQDSESMRCELGIDRGTKVLAPVEASFVRAVGDLMIFYKVGLTDKRVI